MQLDRDKVKQAAKLIEQIERIEEHANQCRKRNGGDLRLSLSGWDSSFKVSTEELLEWLERMRAERSKILQEMGIK